MLKPFRVTCVSNSVCFVSFSCLLHWVISVLVLSKACVAVSWFVLNLRLCLVCPQIDIASIVSQVWLHIVCPQCVSSLVSLICASSCLARDSTPQCKKEAIFRWGTQPWWGNCQLIVEFLKKERKNSRLWRISILLKKANCIQRKYWNSCSWNYLMMIMSTRVS